jgi:hypothetical protein
MAISTFLLGVPVDHVLARLSKAGGHEDSSGKLTSPESSAALAVNTFGWFVNRPEKLPPLPGMAAGMPAHHVDVEYCARFPWRGGRHPWLDAIIETEHQLIGVESKRFEPFRDRKSPSLSPAYDRDVWGEQMGSYKAMRDGLRAGKYRFQYLDATQLVKHAFGLVTDGKRKRKAPTLVYLYAEPSSLHGYGIEKSTLQKHRAEIAQFAEAVSGSEVDFQSSSYRKWFSTWPGPPASVDDHAKALIGRFEP